MACSDFDALAALERGVLEFFEPSVPRPNGVDDVVLAPCFNYLQVITCSCIIMCPFGLVVIGVTHVSELRHTSLLSLNASSPWQQEREYKTFRRCHIFRSIPPSPNYSNFTMSSRSHPNHREPKTSVASTSSQNNIQTPPPTHHTPQSTHSTAPRPSPSATHDNILWRHLADDRWQRHMRGIEGLQPSPAWPLFISHASSSCGANPTRATPSSPGPDTAKPGPSLLVAGRRHGAAQGGSREAQPDETRVDSLIRGSTPLYPGSPDTDILGHIYWEGKMGTSVPRISPCSVRKADVRSKTCSTRC